MSWWDDLVNGAPDAVSIEEQNRQQALADALDKNGPGGGYNPFTDYRPTDDPSAVGRGTYVDDKGGWGYSNADEWMKNMGTGSGGLANEAAPYMSSMLGAMVGSPVAMLAGGARAAGVDTDPLSQLGKMASRANSGSGSGASMPAVGQPGPSGYMAGDSGLPTINGFNEGYNPGDVQQQAMPAGVGAPEQMASALMRGGSKIKAPDYTGGFLSLGM